MTRASHQWLVCLCASDVLSYETHTHGCDGPMWGDRWAVTLCSASLSLNWLFCSTLYDTVGGLYDRYGFINYTTSTAVVLGGAHLYRGWFSKVQRVCVGFVWNKRRSLSLRVDTKRTAQGRFLYDGCSVMTTVWLLRQLWGWCYD